MALNGLTSQPAACLPRRSCFEQRGPPPHERIIDEVSWLREPLDEKARQLRLEAGAVGYLVQRACRSLSGRPKLVCECWDPFASPDALVANESPGGEVVKILQLRTEKFSRSAVDRAMSGGEPVEFRSHGSFKPLLLVEVVCATMSARHRFLVLACWRFIHCSRCSGPHAPQHATTARGSDLYAGKERYEHAVFRPPKQIPSP